MSERVFTVVHNGVPSRSGNADRVRREFGCTADETVLLAVGNLERNKNHRMLLEALVRLDTAGVSARWKLLSATGGFSDFHQNGRRLPS